MRRFFIADRPLILSIIFVERLSFLDQNENSASSSIFSYGTDKKNLLAIYERRQCVVHFFDW